MTITDRQKQASQAPADKNKRIVYIVSAMVLILSPWILLLVTTYISGGTITSSRPLLFDEYQYWHETLSFAEKGLDFGYYAIDEQLPRLSSFGNHGFGTVSLYTLYAKIFGWNYNSIVLANSLFLSLAFFFLVIAIRPAVKTIVMIAVFYLTYMPLILCSQTSLSELINYALLITYFVLLYLYTKTDKYKNALFILLLIFCSYICFIRVIYIILFLPILVERFKITGFSRKLLKAVIIWGIISALLYVINSFFIAPFPYSYLNDLFSTSSASEFIKTFFIHFYYSAKAFIHPMRETVLEVSQRYLIIIVSLILLWKSDIIQTKLKKWRFSYFSVFCILALTLIITFSAYDAFDWRDYRVVAPILFSAIIFITLAENTTIIKIAMGANIIILAIYIFMIPSMSDAYIFKFTEDRYKSVNLNQDLMSIKYNPDAKSKFENTITLDDTKPALAPIIPELTMSIPAGIGINFQFKKISDELNSYYIYSSQEYDLKTYELIKSSDEGFLYKKIDQPYEYSQTSQY
jgi:hypothetical protein